MNAIEFSNKYTSTVMDFFVNCSNVEPMSTQKMQDITVCFTNAGFSLQLKTVKNVFAQKFQVGETAIIPLDFETAIKPITQKHENTTSH